MKQSMYKSRDELPMLLTVMLLEELIAEKKAEIAAEKKKAKTA